MSTAAREERPERATVLTEQQADGVMTVTLNRPERLNALSPWMMEELLAILNAIKQDRAVRSVVLTGSGRGFCTGGDVKDDSQSVLTVGRSAPQDFLRYYRDVIREITIALREISVPTIAMVNGPAYGQGFDLALACDIRIASDTAEFCAAWLRRAAVPAAGTTWLLPQLIGMSRAAEIILTARAVSADEAGQIGLVSRVVPEDELEAVTMALAAQLAEGPKTAQWLTKVALYQGPTMDIRTALDSLAALQVTAFSSPDYEEAAAAHLAHRKPRFESS